MAYVLFDLDGVLVESGPAYRSAWASWAALHGVDETQIWADAHGRRPEEIIRRVAPELDFTEALVAFDSALEAETAAGCRAMPGAADCLAAMPRSRWAIVTSGRSDHVRACLTLCGFPAPSALVCGDEVSPGKPDPECFLLAAERLEARPAACIVVEDAPAGIEAAKAAEMVALAVATTHRFSELHRADRVWSSLACAAPYLIRLSATGCQFETDRQELLRELRRPYG